MAHIYHPTQLDGNMDAVPMSIDTPEGEQAAREAVRDFGGEWAAVYVGESGTPDEHKNGSMLFAAQVAANISLTDAIAWARTAEAGEYLCEYADGEASEADDGSRCGFGDDDLDAINERLGRRGLRLVATDTGLCAVGRVPGRGGVMATYNINVSIGRDCGCEITDDEFAVYLAACESAIEAGYPGASVSAVEHDGSGTRVGNSRPWADDDGDINDACNGICQDVWESCCADGFTRA